MNNKNIYYETLKVKFFKCQISHMGPIDICDQRNVLELMLPK